MATGLPSDAFKFQTTKAILSEIGSSGKLGEIISSPTMQCRKVQIVTDKGVLKAGLLENALKSLKNACVEVAIFDDVVADPPMENVNAALAQAKKLGADCIVGLGGGSSMDVAKLVAVLGHKDTTQRLEDIFGVDNCKGQRLPLIQIPTTAGTGSEVTPISIITTGQSEKKGVVSAQLLPDWAVLDAELTLSVPPHVTAATGIDAMVHAIEAYTTRLRKNHMSDMFAIEALKLLSKNIRIGCENGKDLTARSELLLGACYAGIAFANAPVAAVHALAYPIGSHFKVAHGLSNSLVLPHVLRFNSGNAVAKAHYDQLVKHVFPTRSLEGAEGLASGFADLAKDLNIETQLRQVKIKESDIEMLAKAAMQQTRLLPNNPREVTLEDVVAIYKQAY